jgi:hypothetical protein
MTARKVLTLMLAAKGLILKDNNDVTDEGTGEKVAELINNPEYDKVGGFRYSLKLLDNDYIDIDLGSFHEE